MSHPRLPVDVLMRRERVPGAMARWQPWRWLLAGVEPAQSPSHSDGDAPEPQCVEQSDDHALWRFANMPITLYRDDAEGYHLNLSTDTPCIWVMWRLEPLAGQDEPVAVPQVVTVSYTDAGRWLDAQEHVERVDAPEPLLMWLRAFTDAHYQPEVKRRKRPDSFRSLTDRFGNPVSITTEKAQRGGGAVAQAGGVPGTPRHGG